jgi:hypothetical protein
MKHTGQVDVVRVSRGPRNSLATINAICRLAHDAKGASLFPRGWLVAFNDHSLFMDSPFDLNFGLYYSCQDDLLSGTRTDTNGPLTGFPAYLLPA